MTRNGEHRLLVVEDEPDLRELLRYNLEAAGHAVTAVETGAAALAAWAELAPALIVLDLMLPDVPGTEICRRIRAAASGAAQPAIIMVTAKGAEIDRVVGFELGANDYVVKPFSMRELVLRVTALLRAREGAQRGASAKPRHVVGPLEIDADTFRVFVSGDEVHLSSMEMRLLLYLAENRGRVRTRADLLEHVWGYRPDVSTRTVDTHVKRVRDKLGEAGVLLETVRGIGYRLVDEAR